MDTKAQKIREREDSNPFLQRINQKLTLRKKKMDDIAVSNRIKSISENVNLRCFNDKDNFEIFKDELNVPQQFIQELESKTTLSQKLDYLSNNYFNSDIQIKKYSVKSTFSLLNKIKKSDYENISHQFSQDFINRLFALLFQSDIDLQLLYTTSSIIGLIVYITSVFNDFIIRNAKNIMILITTHPDQIIKKQLLWIFNNVMASGQIDYQKLVNQVSELCTYIINFISQLNMSSMSLYNCMELLPEIIWGYSLILEYDTNKYTFFEQRVYEDIPKIASCLNSQTDFRLYQRTVNFFHIFLRLYYEMNFEDENHLTSNINFDKLEEMIISTNIPLKLLKFFGEYMPIESQIKDNNECMQLIAQEFIYIISVMDVVLDVLIESNIMVKLQHCFDSFKEMKYKGNKYTNLLLLYLNIIIIANYNYKNKYFKTIINENTILKSLSELYFDNTFKSKNTMNIVADIYYSIFESEKMINMCIANLLVWRVPNLFAEVLKNFKNYNISTIEKIGKCLVSIFNYGEKFGEAVNPMIEYLRNENIEETLKLIASMDNLNNMDIKWCENILKKYFQEN